MSSNINAVGRLLLCLVTFLIGMPAAKADLYQFHVRTTEYLVDTSDVIAIVRFASDDRNEAKPPTVVETLKGDVARVRWPLKPSDITYALYAPPADGTLRLVFIRGESELLQMVKLGRSPIITPKLHERFYGVDQFGRLHTTQSQLLKAVRAHLKAKPSRPVRRKRDSVHFETSGINAADDFPFECGDETFVLIVPFTETMRDHYIKQLVEGDAAERLYAIRRLSELEDEKAEAAIRVAAKVADVNPSYRFSWTDRTVHQITAKEVRAAAQAAQKSP